MAYSLIDLEQLRNSREFQDQYVVTAASESGADFNDAFNCALSAIKRILRGATSGTGNWYDAPADSIYNLDVRADALEVASGVLDSRLDQAEIDIDALEVASGVLDSRLDQAELDIDALEAASGVLNIRLTAAELDITQINTFIGRADGDSLPTYTSTVFVTQSGALETAVGQLDAAIAAVSGLVVGSNTWQETFNNGLGLLATSGYEADVRLTLPWRFSDSAGTTDLAIFSASGCLLRKVGEREIYVVPSNQAPSTVMTVPNSKIYTLGDTKFRNLEVFRNGQLLNPGAGNDYTETSAATITMLIGLRKDDVITYRIFG